MIQGPRKSPDRHWNLIDSMLVGHVPPLHKIPAQADLDPPQGLK